MAQTNYTPISLYYSTTASAVPTAANLVPGELAINTNDGKLYYEDSSGVVQVLATKSTGSIGGSNTQVQFNNSGSLGGSSGLTWDGSFLTTSSIKNSALTSGRVTYAGASGLLSDSANLVWDNGNTRLGIGNSSPRATLDITGSVLVNYAQTSTNYATLSVKPSSTITTPSTFTNAINIWNGTNVGEYSNITFGYNSVGLTNAPSYFGFVSTSSSGSGKGDLVFGTRDVTTDTAATERMRITSAGNVGIGNSSPTTTLSVGANAGSSGNGLGIYLSRGATTNFFEAYDGTKSFIAGTDSATGSVKVGSLSNHPVSIVQANGTAIYIDTSKNVGIGTSSPSSLLQVGTGAAASTVQAQFLGGVTVFENTGATASVPTITFNNDLDTGINGPGANILGFYTAGSERMRISSDGSLLVGKTVNDTTTNGVNLSAAGRGSFSSNGQAVGDYNRTGDDGTLVNFLQDGTIEGSISVSGTTVSYNGGHLSRWSQWQNQSGQPNINRGTVLESTNDMCEWGQTNEQSTKTIVSTTAKSKAVAGVFDMYDSDDKTNPNDFYVAQSGDFVIRIAQGIVVENGDLLESAGDGTARPQTDDICRSSTIAKVTSNYVSTTYADGSFCVPCILMIG